MIAKGKRWAEGLLSLCISWSGIQEAWIQSPALFLAGEALSGWPKFCTWSRPTLLVVESRTWTMVVRPESEWSPDPAFPSALQKSQDSSSEELFHVVTKAGGFLSCKASWIHP